MVWERILSGLAVLGRGPPEHPSELPAAIPNGRRSVTRSSCYTDFVLKNMTITVSEEAALWARRKAADENTSVSKLVG